ncbi:MAG: hypothetical protein WC547_05200 [Candidatus Omnitrophota bacterium]
MILFSDVKSQVKAIGFETLRTESDTYFEVVFLKAKLAEYSTVLNGVFGRISWPSDSPISAEVKAAIAQYGSVMAGQTLYAMQEGNHIMFAMLWPWGDREHITLKTGERT